MGSKFKENANLKGVGKAKWLIIEDLPGFTFISANVLLRAGCFY
jgi:hypothetical protein